MIQRHQQPGHIARTFSVDARGGEHDEQWVLRFVETRARCGYGGGEGAHAVCADCGLCGEDERLEERPLEFEVAGRAADAGDDGVDEAGGACVDWGGGSRGGISDQGAGDGVDVTDVAGYDGEVRVEEGGGDAAGVEGGGELAWCACNCKFHVRREMSGDVIARHTGINLDTSLKCSDQNSKCAAAGGTETGKRLRKGFCIHRGGPGETATYLENALKEESGSA